MIANLAFEPRGPRVRRARFVPRPNLPVDAACVVANGMREALRGVLDDACAVTLGEPVALDAAAWRSLCAGAMLFATPGRATDIAFVLGRHDARRLLHAAFGEEATGADGPLSALEAGAIERIVARCAIAVEAICVERRGPTASIDAARLATPVAYFDVRITAPVAFTIGVGMLQEPPAPPPAPLLPAAVLGGLAVEVHAVLGHAVLPVPRLLELAVGTVVPLRTKVAGEGELNLAGQRIAFGTCGVRNGHAAFEVRSIAMRGDAS
jgi:flagellar motor switch/type III secretory pathway protein FliN